jgi:hypothetical protein
MPQRPKILTLPEDIKAELDRRLISGGFGDYVALSAWLAEQGFEISKSAIHKYGQEFEARLWAIKTATEQARAICEATGDDQGALGDSLTQLVQEKAFQVLMDMQDLDPEKVDFTKLGRMVAELNRASIAQKKWITEVREKAKKAVENVEKKIAGQIDPETLRKVREEIYGIVG